MSESIRLKNILDSLGLSGDDDDHGDDDYNNEKIIYYLLEEISIYCFKKGIEPKAFVYKIHELSNIAASIGISIYDIPSYINEKREICNNLDKEIVNRKQQIEWLYTI